MLAEHLVADRGDEVEVFTSAALDALTWRDELPLGTETHQRRHRAPDRLGGGAGRGFHPLSGMLLADPGHASEADCERWVDLQGPEVARPPPRRGRPATPMSSPSTPTCTIRPSAACPWCETGPSSIRRPTKSRLSTFPSSTPCSPSAAALPSTPAANGGWWRSASAWPPRRRWWSAWGSKRQTDQRSRPGRRSASATRPYLLCIGRVDDKKGTGILWRYFRAYKERHPGDLRLVLVGQIVDPPDHGPRHRR